MTTTMIQINIILKEIEGYREQIDALKKKEYESLNKISHLKKQIEKDNSWIIGKQAWVKVVNNEGTKVNEFMAVCSAVMCNDDFTVRPLFNDKHGKKISPIEYKWK